MTLTEIATTDVVTASPDTGVREVLDTMADREVGSTIVTEGDDLRGIVTDRMIAMACRDRSPGELTAGDVMTEDLVTADESENHFDVLERMRDEGIRRMPIESDGSLSAILTLDDVVMLTAAELSTVSDVIERQTAAT